MLKAATRDAEGSSMHGTITAQESRPNLYSDPQRKRDYPALVPAKGTGRAELSYRGIA